MSACAYCGVARGAFTDHLITKNQARRGVKAAQMRNCDVFKVPACRNCNEAKGTRLLVPPSHEDAIPMLEAITGGVYRVWSGDAKSLRSVMR